MTKREDTEKIRSTVAERVKTLRHAAGLTQERLAEFAGLGPEYVSRLESASRTPSLDALVSIAAALQVNAADLVGKPRDGVRAERVARIEAVLSGLSDRDSAFLEAELTGWASHLRQR